MADTLDTLETVAPAFVEMAHRISRMAGGTGRLLIWRASAAGCASAKRVESLGGNPRRVEAVRHALR